MFDFLSKFDFSEVLVLIVLPMLFVLFIILKGRFAWKWGDKQLAVGDSSAITNQSKHAACPFVNDLFTVIAQTTYTLHKISLIKIKTTLYEQMNFAEQKIEVIREIFEKNYQMALVQKGVANPSDNDDYRFYSILWKILDYDIQAFFRSSFVDNHLLQYSGELEYQKYIDGKIKVIFARIKDFFDTMYIGQRSLSRDEIKVSANVKLLDEVSILLKEIFINGLRVAETKEKEIDNLENELKTFVSKIVGVEINATKI